ncbi:MAG: TetR/AcrR family transcriptional regulator [Lachnospiraceae bacterium]|nr:TetR/AcrR family transcriptional regulator [Lachnospiraceae bacterium]
MAKRNSVSKEALLDAAFELVRSEGTRALSARKVANAAECSTQPIFRLYKNMGELSDEVFLEAVDFYTDYFLEKTEEKEGGDSPFVDFGMAYVSFAKDEPHLFQMLFLEENSVDMSMYDILNGGDMGFVRKEIQRLSSLGAERSQMVFMRIWLFLHGIACMELGADFDLSENDMRSMLKDVFTGFYGKIEG